MNDQTESPRVWARKGEAVVCIKGHPICEVSRDIMIGDPRHGGDFTNWVQPEPDRKTSVATIRCVECRGVWIRGNPKDGYQFHFAEGWR